MTLDFVDSLLGIVIQSFIMPEGAESITFVDHYLLVITESEQLHKFNLEDGNFEWALEFGSSIAYPPVVSDGRLFIVTGTSMGEFGTVIAIDFETAEEVWFAEIPILDGNAYPIMSPFLVLSSSAVMVNGFGFLYAYDVRTGEQCWDTESAKYGLAMPSNSPATSEDLVVFEADGNLMGLDVQNGEIKWTTGGFQQATDIALDDSQAFAINSDGQLTSVNVDNGEVLWTQSDASYVFAKLLVTSGAIYATDQEGHLYSHSIIDGTVNWSMPVGEVYTQMYATADRVYVQTEDELILITETAP